MSDKVVIEFRELSKIYKLYNEPMDRLKEAFSRKNKEWHTEHYALRNINLTILKGEAVGIVGKNGSGKSTLLKILTGVLNQTSGEKHVRGTISAILELGAGFNPEYTGIENIYLNGTMLGYTKEQMNERLQSIVDFADIGEFINQPVKTYSSGMFARLAFAVASNVEPEILIVDEALAVGDTRFQIKCIEKMKALKEKGTTILFVSHATEQVKRFCNRAIWLYNGEIKADGEASEIVDVYDSYMKTGEIGNIEKENTVVDVVAQDIGEFKKPDEETLALIKHTILNKNKFKTFDKLEVTVVYDIYEEQIEGFLLGVAIYTPTREYIFGPNTYLERINIPNTKGRHCIKYKIPELMLLGGEYGIDIGIFNNEGIVCLDYKSDEHHFTIVNNYFSEGKIYMKNEWVIEK